MTRLRARPAVGAPAGSLHRVSVTDRPRKPLGQLRPEVLTLEVGEINPLTVRQRVTRHVGDNPDLRHAFSFLETVIATLLS
jgi:hypothetical protein